MIMHISYCIAQEYQWKLMDLLPQKTLIEDNCWYDQRGEFAIMPQITLMCSLNHYSYLPYIYIYTTAYLILAWIFEKIIE